MRNIEEIESKISLLYKHRRDKPPQIQKNYDNSIQILKWVLGEDKGMETLGWRQRILEIKELLKDWPHDKHSAFNLLIKIREVAEPPKEVKK